MVLLAKIETREDALRQIKATSLMFLLVGAAEAAMGLGFWLFLHSPSPMIEDAVAFALLGAVLMKWKARPAAVLLVVLSVFAVANTLTNRSGSGIIIDLAFFAFAIRACEATFKLHSKSLGEEPAPELVVPTGIRRDIRNGWIVGVICGLMVLTTAAIERPSGREANCPFPPCNPVVVTYLFVSALYLGFAYGIWRKSRVCTILILLVFGNEFIKTHVTSKGLAEHTAGFYLLFLALDLVFFYFYARAVLGTVRYHKIARSQFRQGKSHAALAVEAIDTDTSISTHFSAEGSTVETDQTKPTEHAIKQTPVGVSASAIIAIVGGVFTILVAIFNFNGPLVADTTFPRRESLILLAFILAALGLWGIVSGIGLMRRRNWARLCGLVFAGLLALWSLGAIWTVVLIISTPSQTDARTYLGPAWPVIVSGLMIVFVLLPLALSVWWLVYFNRREIKAHFVRSPQKVFRMPVIRRPGTL